MEEQRKAQRTRKKGKKETKKKMKTEEKNTIKYINVIVQSDINPYPTAFPYGNGMVLHFYQQQESSTTKTANRVINKRLKTYV